MTELEKFKLLAERLDYDSETGVFTWKNDMGRYGTIKKGTRAGRVSAGGRQISIYHESKCYSVYSRRLAMFMVTGEVPETNVTTKDGDPFNDAFGNLQTDVSENHKKKRYSNNRRTGTGVYFNKCFGKWLAEVKLNGKRHRKSFDNQLDAEVWVIDKRNELGFDGNLHGRIEQ